MERVGPLKLLQGSEGGSWKVARIPMHAPTSVGGSEEPSETLPVPKTFATWKRVESTLEPVSQRSLDGSL